jgi:hypothetical protein
MNRLRFPAGMYLGGMAVTGATAVWDIWTHGQLLVALVTIGATVLIGASWFGQWKRSQAHGRQPATPVYRAHARVGEPASSLLSRPAAAMGFPSARSLVLRSTVGVAAITIFERFVLYPSAAVAFDVMIAAALLGIGLLANFAAVRSRLQ